MNVVGIFLGKPLLTPYLQSTPYYVKGYGELALAIQDQGGQMVLLDNQESYLGNNTFQTHWKYQNGEFKKFGQIQVDVTYNKGHFRGGSTATVFNPTFIENICVDKSLTYKYFHQDCPVTIVVNSLAEMEIELANIPTEMIVAKPVDGGEGTAVYIFPKSELPLHTLSFPLLLQEFMDTSNGIPRIMTGIHDLRVAVLNGEIAYSFYRTPPEGTLIANVAQGGSFHMIANNKIPPEVVDLIRKIDASFEKYPYRYYGIDVAFTPQGVKIIELNSHLGLSLEIDSGIFGQLNQELAKTLLAVSKLRNN